MFRWQAFAPTALPRLYISHATSENNFLAPGGDHPFGRFPALRSYVQIGRLVRQSTFALHVSMSTIGGA
jgi:hypothetical protein